MAEGLALTGRQVLVTRPAAQADALMAALRAEGAEPFFFPVIDIVPLADVNVLQGLPLADFDLVFFVSRNAVAEMLRQMPAGRWPASLRVATVGPGSAAALRAAGFAGVIAPTTQFDSEGVLALPEFAASRMAGRRVLILRGEGGRELLADTLRARGAEVVLQSCYRRVCPQPDIAPLLAVHAAGRLDAASFTSSEGVRNFASLLGDALVPLLADLPCFVPHPRIAASLHDCGARNVHLTAVGDAGLIAALTDYFG